MKTDRFRIKLLVDCFPSKWQRDQSLASSTASDSKHQDRRGSRSSNREQVKTDRDQPISRERERELGSSLGADSTSLSSAARKPMSDDKQAEDRQSFAAPWTKEFDATNPSPQEALLQSPGVLRILNWSSQDNLKAVEDNTEPAPINAPAPVTPPGQKAGIGAVTKTGLTVLRKENKEETQICCWPSRSIYKHWDTSRVHNRLDFATEDRLPCHRDWRRNEAMDEQKVGWSTRWRSC